MAAPEAPDRVTVAAAQYPIERLASPAAVGDKLARWIGDAAALRADLVVFPEYGLMELAGTCEDAVAADLAASLDGVARLRGALDRHLADLAREHAIHILGPSGPLRRDDGRIVNAALFATPSGRSAMVEKCIMTPFERDWGIVGGTPPVVLDTALGRIGVLICYDCEFPLLARAQVLAGARLILVPSCTERISGYHRVRTGAQARALESTIATVQSPTIGEAPWSPAVDRNAGAAGIYVPAEAGVSDTGVIASGPLDEAALVTGTIDFARLARAKASGEMRNSADWSLQPGAEEAATSARVVSLRD
jgi:predicted amidohydrolase